MAKKKKVEKVEEVVEDVKFNKMVEEEEILEKDFEEFDDEDSMAHEEHTCNCGDHHCASNENKGLKGLLVVSCITLCISVVVLLVSLITLNKVNNLNGTASTKEETEEVQEAEYDVSMFKEINAKEFIKMFKEKDGKRHYIYTGTSSCSYCLAFLPSLQKSVKEYDYTLYYLDVAKLTQEEVTEIQKLDDKFAEFFGYTPMVFVTKNAVVRDVNEGYVEYETFAKFLEENKVSKK